MPSPIRRRRVQPVKEEVKKLKILFLGDPGTGKSELAQALARRHGSVLAKHYAAAGALPTAGNTEATVGVDLMWSG